MTFNHILKCCAIQLCKHFTRLGKAIIYNFSKTDRHPFPRLCRQLLFKVQNESLCADALDAQSSTLTWEYLQLHHLNPIWLKQQCLVPVCGSRVVADKKIW